MWFFHPIVLLLFHTVLSIEVNESTTTEKIQIVQPESNNKTQEARPQAPQISQTQKIERTILQPINETQNKALLSDFKPSPPLENYYEYNKFPVPPALPEAKQYNHLNPEEFQARPWTESSIFTTEQPWSTHVKFPVQERPYNFENRPAKYDSRPSHGEGFAFNKPVGLPDHLKPTMSHEAIGTWNKFSQKKPPALHKTNFDFNLNERPGGIHKTYEHGLSEHGHGENPWKKIFKLLTTFIPLGLLLSALTPTVITVTPMNDTTQTRYRAINVKSSSDLSERLISSFHHYKKLQDEGCEDRILCELLLTASQSKNAEQHVENLLNNLTEQENIKNKADDLRKVFAAVKRQNCKEIKCEDIKH